VIFIAGIAWTVGASLTFQGCVSKEQNHADAQSTKDSVAVLSRPEIYRDCLGVFVIEQNPAITALSTFVIAIFTIVLAAVTSRQARLTKEALIADKAAFVFPFGFEQFFDLDAVTGFYNWRFRPQWRNSGDTAAKEVMIHAECEIRNTAIPAGHRFNYEITDEQRGFMAPRAEHGGAIAPAPPHQAAVTAQDIADAQAGRKFIYLWGWTRYRDVFPGTPSHITKFCWSLLFRAIRWFSCPIPLVPSEPRALWFSHIFSTPKEIPQKTSRLLNLNPRRDFLPTFFALAFFILSSPGTSPIKSRTGRNARAE
jgi:hypothetical protein